MKDSVVNKLVEEAEVGTAVATHLKRVGGGKISVQIVEKIQGEENLVGLLNKEDDRFSQTKARPAWITGTPESCIREFGMNVTLKQINALQIATGIPDTALEEGKTKLNLGIVEPKVKGAALHVEIFEDLKPHYEDQEPKRAGKDGDFLTYEGKLIYSSTRVVNRPAKHSRIIHDGRVPAGAYSKFNQETLNAARVAFIGEDEPAE